MDNNKFNNIDIDTIMKIAQTGKNPKKVGGNSINTGEDELLILEWMKHEDLKEGPVRVVSSDLHHCFKKWYKETKDKEMNIRKFGRILSKLLRKMRTRQGQMYLCNKNPKDSVTNEKENKKK